MCILRKNWQRILPMSTALNLFSGVMGDFNFPLFTFLSYDFFCHALVMFKNRNNNEIFLKINEMIWSEY